MALFVPLALICLLLGYPIDVLGRLTSVTQYSVFRASYPIVNPGAFAPTGAAVVTSFGHDANGNQVWALDGNQQGGTGPVEKRRTGFEYDAMNRRVLVRFPEVDGVQKTERTVYDGLGRRVQEIDEAGVVTAFGYDALGRLTSVTNDFQPGASAPVVTRYGYDEVGNQISQTDALGRVTRYEYDGLGRRTHRFLPGASLADVASNSGMEKSSYEKVTVSPGVFKERKLVRDFRNLTITYDYDLAGRLERKVLPAANSFEPGTKTVSYSYYSGGQLKQVSEDLPARTSYYKYDGLGRLRQKDTPEGVVTWQYHADNEVATIRGFKRNAAVPDGEVTGAASVSAGYGYNALGRLSSVTNYSLGGNPTTTYSYDASGNLDLVNYPNGVTTDYHYTRQDRLSELELRNGANLLRKYSYTLGLSGNRTKVVEHQASGIRRTVNYEYDKDSISTPVIEGPKLYRLGKEEILNGSGTAAGTFLYRMDAVGNRLNRTVTGLSPAPPDAIPSQTMLWDQLDRHDYNENISDGNIRYDANGNTIMTGEFYDAENRLIRKNGSPWRVSYIYDHEGNKVQRIYQSDVNNPATISTVHYLVDDRNPTGYAQQVMELSSSGGAQTVIRTYVWGHQLVSQTISASSATHYYGHDGHGSVRMLFDSAGAVASTYDYDAYGNLLAFTGTTANSHRYGGEWYDDQVKAYYQRARYYNYGYGRFWSRDSFEGRMEDPQSLHKYVYCHNDPVNNIDPSGYETIFGISVASAIGQGLHNKYDAGVTVVGNSLKNTIIGVYSKMSVGQIVALNLVDNIGGVVAGKLIGKAAELRKLPGIAKGYGVAIHGGNWLRGSHGNAGFIPQQIAQRLAGRKFKSFDSFRKTFWREVARDADLTKGFNSVDRARMKNGNAPFVHATQSVGDKVTYELHHVRPIQHGGEVYDLDNMAVVTPRYHLDVLERAYHY